ncbi:hypothetical protein DMH04_45655 [Kibdelosporangium aridum]|uniref:Uncharacterized protein n=1 Tax=Kibdelosporangium aridum TaxID=2030 RepID=A0A428YNB2_KIBAR|nr:hypothetical protein [Kibdelosporangium aridum]RSM69836.1 hypothetical protein DMH04_45655 [Kibdelosporangium aridum]
MSIDLIPVPSYYKFFNRTYKITREAKGDLIGHELNLRTAEFDLATHQIDRILFDVHADIDRVNEAEFIDATEVERATYLRGDGPIFALYDTINGIIDQMEREGRRRLEPHERALVTQLRKQTFAMWEEEFARRAAGEEPQNTFKTVLPPKQEASE